MSNHSDLLNLHSGLDKLPGQNGTNLGHADVQSLLSWLTSGVGGPWAMAHLAFIVVYHQIFWLARAALPELHC